MRRALIRQLQGKIPCRLKSREIVLHYWLPGTTYDTYPIVSLIFRGECDERKQKYDGRQQ